MITKEFGSGIAERIGRDHEANPGVDLSVRTFSGDTAFAMADQTIDLLNNEIGRNIAIANPNASSQQLGLLVVEEFHTQGLFTATQNADGTVSATRTRITDEQHNNARNTINGLNNNGRTAQEQQREDSIKKLNENLTRRRDL